MMDDIASMDEAGRVSLLTEALAERDAEVARLLARVSTLASLLQAALPAGQEVRLTASGVEVVPASGEG